MFIGLCIISDMPIKTPKEIQGLEINFETYLSFLLWNEICFRRLQGKIQSRLPGRVKQRISLKQLQ